MHVGRLEQNEKKLLMMLTKIRARSIQFCVYFVFRDLVASTVHPFVNKENKTQTHNDNSQVLSNLWCSMKMSPLVWMKKIQKLRSFCV